jgi:nucleotide-binding universal stress UspA family protein
MGSRVVVVGTDGTPSSTAAVRWAAREAVQRDALLRITCAYDRDWEAAPAYAGGEPIDVPGSIAESATVAAMDEARRAAPPVRVERDAVAGSAARLLLDMSEHVELTVLGSHGRGSLADLMLGSVGTRVATHAGSPVVVVRGRAGATGPVVAGVDDSPATDTVLRNAFEFAAEHHADLEVVHTYLPAALALASDVPLADVRSPREDAARSAWLDRVLAPWREKYPQVTVTPLLSYDRAAGVLLHAARHASLVVVGSRNRGPLAGALLGSVGIELIHHADAPVLIARERGGR